MIENWRLLMAVENGLILTALTTWPALSTAVVILIGLAIWYTFHEPAGLPPGPTPWPIVGNLFGLEDRKPFRSMARWAEKYGPIYRMYFGDILTIVLNDTDSIKECFSGQNGEISSGRPSLPILDAFSGGTKMGIICSDGERWKEQRRFTMSLLRDFGVGRPLMEAKIHLEVEKMLEQFDEAAATGKPTDVHFMALKTCGANIISSIIIGHSFEPGDPEFFEFQGRVSDIVYRLALADPLPYIKGLRLFAPYESNIRKLNEHFAVIRSTFLRNQINKHKTDLPASVQEATDFTAAYLLKMKELENSQQENGGKQHWFSTQQLESIISDLFLAGQETTVTTMIWALAYMAEYQEIQAKVQMEMEEKVGRLPTWEDRNKLTYTCAAIAEIQRISTLAPMGMFHYTNEPMRLAGFKIPAKTMVVANLWAAQMNPKEFPEPERFNPDRFIDEKTGALTGVDKLVTFSVGKRVCLGESLARMELFMMFTAILYRYRLGKTDQPLDFEPIFGAVLSPKPFKLFLTKR